MITLRNRPYASAADLPGLQTLWPACRPAAWQTDFPSPTDLAELLAAPEAAAHTQVWEDAAGLVHAYALVDDYDNLWFDRTPEVTDSNSDEIVAWGIACARDLAASSDGPAVLDTACRAEDDERIAQLRRHGFTEQAVRTLRFVRALAEPIPEPTLPAGYTIRPVAGEPEVEALVTLHRAAFGTEQMTGAERLRWMRAPGYDPALDLVAVAPDGSLAAYCFCAIQQEENRLSDRNDGVTDPLATHPSAPGPRAGAGAAVRRDGAAAGAWGRACAPGDQQRQPRHAGRRAGCWLPHRVGTSLVELARTGFDKRRMSQAQACII